MTSSDLVRNFLIIPDNTPQIFSVLDVKTISNMFEIVTQCCPIKFYFRKFISIEILELPSDQVTPIKHACACPLTNPLSPLPLALPPQLLAPSQESSIVNRLALCRQCPSCSRETRNSCARIRAVCLRFDACDVRTPTQL